MTSALGPQPRVVEVIQLELLCNVLLSNVLSGAITHSIHECSCVKAVRDFSKQVAV